MRARLAVPVLLSAALVCAVSSAQMLSPPPPDSSSNPSGNLLTNPGATPAVEFLFGLDEQFSADTAKGGGAAFASWFAPDAVTLANGKAPVEGQDAIAAQATWSAQSYQLTWTPEGARMGPNSDMGLTWGHYRGVSKDKEGNAVTTTGRYITVWKKQPDGKWKVEMDASNDGPAADCCSLRQ